MVETYVIHRDISNFEYDFDEPQIGFSISNEGVTLVYSKIEFKKNHEKYIKKLLKSSKEYSKTIKEDLSKTKEELKLNSGNLENIDKIIDNFKKQPEEIRRIISFVGLVNPSLIDKYYNDNLKDYQVITNYINYGKDCLEDFNKIDSIRHSKNIKLGLVECLNSTNKILNVYQELIEVNKSIINLREKLFKA
ncbi:MAG: hypothetical protein KKE93_00555 [Nanoarchaeota archaeon]|nr:hypothetical protein [Nanoarchaeota archaeon]